MKLALFALAGTAAAALAGTALAAGSSRHTMDLPLPDGGVVHIEYRGDVAPKVTISPISPIIPVQMPGGWAPVAWPAFPDIGAMIEQMNRQMREIERMARQPAGSPGLNVASYGNLPAGANSVSVVSVINGGRTCTRTTEVISQGPGKPPKVATKLSGDCTAEGAAHAPPQTLSEAPISHT